MCVISKIAKLGQWVVRGCRVMTYLISAALFMAGYLAFEATVVEGIIILFTASALVWMLIHREDREVEAMIQARLEAELE